MVEIEEITLKFEYDQEVDTFNCHKKEKIKNILFLYKKMKRIELESVYFLCGGRQINNFEQTFEKLGKQNYFSFLVLKYPKSVSIIFSYSGEEYEVKKDAENKFDNIFSDYAEKKNINKSKLIFKYKGIEIDPKETIDDFLKNDNININELYNNSKMNQTRNETNIQESENIIKIKIEVIDADIKLIFNFNQDEDQFECNRKDPINKILSIYCKMKHIELNSVYFLIDGEKVSDYEKTFETLAKNKENKELIFLVYKYPKTVFIYFSFLNSIDREEQDAQDKFENIFYEYASKKNINKKKLIFKYNNFPVDESQTIDEFLRQKIVNINELNKNNNDVTFNSMPIQEDDIEIKIDVEEIPLFTYLCKYHKRKIFIIIAILSIIFIAGIIVLVVLLSKGGSDKGSTLSPKPKIINSTNLTDYFIKATYFSQANENVRLVSNKYNLNKIKNMSIDGSIINPTKFYTFSEEGQHIIYFSFNKYNNNLNLSEGNGIFSGIENLKYVEFSNYSEYYPDVRYDEMFNSCKNLESVDFSRIQLDYTTYYSNGIDYNNFDYEHFFTYFNSLDYMFNNCTSLKSLNFENKNKNRMVYMSIISSKFMFSNCILLEHINLASIYFGGYEQLNINNMFSNCISLQTVYFNEISFAEKTNMSYMFYNCSSLVSFEFPSIFVERPYDMSYAFSYCSSIKKLELEFSYNILYEGKTMSNAFKNCTSLTSIYLNFYVDYEDTSYAFMGCTSLQKINILSFEGYNVKYMNGMFYDCYYLYSVDFLSYGFHAQELIDISYMFSGCHYLRGVDFSMITTDKIKNYRGLFYDCFGFYYVDISSFTHNNLPDYNLSIFNNYNGHHYYYKPVIYVNEDFLSKVQIPSFFEILTHDNISEMTGIMEDVPVTVPPSISLPPL